MRAHVLTRGWRRQDDYTFFPAPPEDRWWERYGEYVDFDYPSLLVEADGVSWRAYLGGLTTSREDVTGTPIRLSLALAGDCGPGRETDWAARLVEEHVHGQGRGDEAGAAVEKGALGALDQVFDEAAVAALFAGPPEPGAGADDLVDTAVRGHADTADTAVRGPGGTAVRGPADTAGNRSPVDRSPAQSPSTPTGSWVAGIGGAEAREAFVGHAGALLNGTVTGRALVLNSLHDPDALPRPAPGEHLVVLADAPEERFGRTPVAIGGKVSGRPPAAPVDSRLVWAALAVGVAIVLVRCARRRSASPQRDT
ncbi:hypothetical protein [Streptomyces sp. HD]|uniref:hypothetical protein n=1 Tax=Streptomyces sp. HD TaxID=3020892 RepID=UPI00232E2D2C|nr:hypothetical protein [Streptomyces sp. HD]MDC0772724.1 hypothetical protein [Streptomyces sp. HD]